MLAPVNREKNPDLGFVVFDEALSRILGAGDGAFEVAGVAYISTPLGNTVLYNLRVP